MKLILKIIFNTLKVIFTALVIIALIVIIIQRVTNNKLRLFGYGVYTVVSESMLPDYEIGDMFLAKEVDEEYLEPGIDIVYIGEKDSYKDKIITHRIIRIEADKTIVTKGINNDLEDPPIKYKQVYGKVIARFVVLSLFSKLMNNNALFYVIIFVPFTILIFLDTKELFDEKKKGDGKEDNKESSQESTNVVNQIPSTIPTTIPSTSVPENNSIVEERNNVEMPTNISNNVPNDINNTQQSELINNTINVSNEVKEDKIENKE